MRGRIFNTDQVRAIQSGRMTQFMQEVKPQPNIDNCPVGGSIWLVKKGLYLWEEDDPSLCATMTEYCPLGKVGDVIYVREGWFNDADFEEAAIYVHKENFPNFPLGGCKWRSPATMPREAARLFLRIENIRVMRVQELKWGDFEKQGYPGYRPIQQEPVDQFKTSHMDIWEANKFHWILDFTKTDKP